MPVKSLTLLILVLGSIGVARPAETEAVADSSIQSLMAIQRAAVIALRTELDSPAAVELDAVALDNRLRLPACGAALGTSVVPPRNGQSRVLVRVSCAANGYWNVNVPVDIQRTTTVLILKRAVGRGEILSSADVAVQTRVLPGLASSFVSSIDELPGRVTRRPIASGTALQADALDAALLIHRGQSVTLSSSAAGLEVRAPGQAMADAGPNQRVRVRNLLSLKIVEGMADTDGMVRVNP
jgi:flagella basal body P-ring formation protein FlgA